MDQELPEFDVKAAKRGALPLVKRIFTESFVRLKIDDDGACRVFFKPTYFAIQEGHDEPTRSQWSTLKKRVKRHNRGVFIFKETGKAPCQPDSIEDDACYYIDFGFFKY